LGALSSTNQCSLNQGNRAQVRNSHTGGTYPVCWSSGPWSEAEELTLSNTDGAIPRTQAKPDARSVAIRPASNLTDRLLPSCVTPVLHFNFSTATPGMEPSPWFQRKHVSRPYRRTAIRQRVTRRPPTKISISNPSSHPIIIGGANRSPGWLNHDYFISDFLHFPAARHLSYGHTNGITR
jgi:hypothetical protein